MFEKPIELFQAADADQNGTLDFEEFQKFVVKMAKQYPQLASNMKKMLSDFQEADSDKSGTLGLEEFKAFLKKADRKLKTLPATGQGDTSPNFGLSKLSFLILD